MGRDELRDWMLIIIAARIRILAKNRIWLADVFGWLVDFCQRTCHQHSHIRTNPVMGDEMDLLLDVSIRNE